jgi:hypothetical protein
MPERPPKRWMKSCTEGVKESGGADDPGAVCGNIWYNKKTKKEREQITREEESRKRRKHK